MPSPRHKHVASVRRQHRVLPVAAALAALAVIASGSVGLPSTQVRDVAAGQSATTATTPNERAADLRPNRSANERPSVIDALPTPEPAAAGAEVAAPLKVVAKRYVTTALNVRTGPGDSYRTLTTLAAGTRVPVTDVVRGAWRQVVHKGTARWVKAAYLSVKKPQQPTDVQAGKSGTGNAVSGKACATGSSVENGLRPHTIAVHRAVCALFPQVTTYGGLRGDGEHSQGQALDIMIGTDSSLGRQIADWVRANASRLGVSEVIWSQHIWTTQRSSEGWRSMPDRGSTTANHYDHVHVTTN